MSYTLITRQHCININNYVMRELAMNLNLLKNGSIQEVIHPKTAKTVSAIKKILPQTQLRDTHGFNRKFKKHMVSVFQKLDDGQYWVIINGHINKDHPDAVYTFGYIQHIEEGKEPEDADRLAKMGHHAAMESVKKKLKEKPESPTVH
jgi:hypothetical protein